jgi:hypothetical protein
VNERYQFEEDFQEEIVGVQRSPLYLRENI